MPEICLDSLGAVFVRQNPITFGCKMVLHKIQLMGLVFYEKNRCAIPSSLVGFRFFVPCGGMDERCGIARHGQINIESRAVARLARHIDEPAVAGNDAVNDREPKAASLSLGLGREERFKNATFDRLVETVSGIRHADPYVLFLPRFLKMLAQLDPADGSRL